MDQYLNIKLQNISVTDPEKYPHMVSVDLVWPSHGHSHAAFTFPISLRLWPPSCLFFALCGAALTPLRPPIYNHRRVVTSFTSPRCMVCGVV